MKTNKQLGGKIRDRREALGWTQRSLAEKLGVESSHIAYIEAGYRKPSLKLLAHLAGILDIDRQNLLFLAPPEVKELLDEPKLQKRPKPAASWQRFIENHELLDSYHVTDSELRVLEDISLLGALRSPKEFLVILTLLRDIPLAK